MKLIAVISAVVIGALVVRHRKNVRSKVAEKATGWADNVYRLPPIDYREREFSPTPTTEGILQ